MHWYHILGKACNVYILKHAYIASNKMVVFLALSKQVLSPFFPSVFLSVFSEDFLSFPLAPKLIERAFYNEIEQNSRTNYCKNQQQQFIILPFSGTMNEVLLFD
jgi:hypothetical protein